jgi:hypothetical protein
MVHRGMGCGGIQATITIDLGIHKISAFENAVALRGDVTDPLIQ